MARKKIAAYTKRDGTRVSKYYKKVIGKHKHRELTLKRRNYKNFQNWIDRADCY